MNEPQTAASAPGRVRELATDQRPSERLARHGTALLSTRELLAVVLGAGRFVSLEQRGVL